MCSEGLIWLLLRVGWAGTKPPEYPVLIGFEHEYDAAGNKRYQRSLHDPLDSQRYAYDSASRLLAYSRGFFGVGDTAPDDARFCDAPATTTWSGVASESALQREVWPPKRDPLLPCTSLHRNA